MNRISLAIVSVVYLLAACSAQNWPFYNLWTRESPNTTIKITSAVDLQASSIFSNARRTYMIVHGYSGTSNLSYLLDIKAALLEKEDANVLAVDWSKASSFSIFYTAAIENAKEVGKRVAQFINATQINPLSVHCIGHSLGAHVCGFIGKNIKLDRISGIDPAGPLFSLVPASGRLDISDANHVDVIHATRLIGLQKPIGHKDFYPNGGLSQCSTGMPDFQNEFEASTSSGFFLFSTKDTTQTISDIVCSHVRPLHYFVESIRSTCSFTAVKCSNYLRYKLNLCSTSGTASMGINSVNSPVGGSFYLDTNLQSPFCKS